MTDNNNIYPSLFECFDLITRRRRRRIDEGVHHFAPYTLGILGIIRDNTSCLRERKLGFFSSLFASTHPAIKDIDEVIECVPSITNHINDILTGAVNSEEILSALKQMADSKALGPDGMSAMFFQKYWDIVGLAVCQACISFFHRTSSLASINDTLLL